MTDPSPLFSLPQQTEHCPLCQQPLQIRSGKNGAFLGCTGYPSCHYIKALHQHETSVVKVLEQEHCPECSSALAVKNGRYGMFIGCTNYPACHFIVHEEPVTTEQPNVSCPKCQQGSLTERLSKFGKTFWGCDRYPQCKFIVNDQPVVGICQYCAFPLLLQKKSGQVCASKACQQKQTAPDPSLD
ncbi:DNA topoisomerase family protein [Rheinheimera sp. UJ63]|uniref:DNA topoisomerase family protein n=1 Tax=Rheinheimera sp. UJ63 TaxID=2910157 RepID=UPI001F1822F4|nr:topoisomerase DNA-binding C4 zinc finger domain-containing protein [Rheinheimera sp. UJ63]MCF4008954.1 topoisomerase DNA-binding C4 zinc finger domain-containing protein [Rheinheimera sp. UJ63]